MIYSGETRDEDIDDTSEIVILMSEGGNKALTTNKNFHYLMLVLI
jgi:hypothetical protein